MGNVTSLFSLLEKLESADITVHQNRCAVVRNRNATCMRCAEVCTSGCISYEDNELIIAPERCVGCGTCATVCPTCALEANKPNDAELQQRCIAAMKAAEGEAIIACDQILAAADGLYDPEKVVGVTCLGRVEETLLTALAVAGVDRVSLVKAKCAECPQAVGHATTELVVDTANTLLETWSSPVHVEIVEKFPKIARLTQDQDYDHSRRDFFSGIKGDAKTAAVKTTDFAVKEALGVTEEAEPKYLKVMEDGTLPHFIPDRRERLLDNLAALGEPQDVMIDTRLWGHVVIEPELCTSCQMCATFCPTGAIAKFKEEDGTFGIEHFPGDCVKCRCCTDICPESALSLSDEVFAVDLLSGLVERYEMKPMKNPPNNPHAILHSIKDLIGLEQIYER
ncbi:MAG: 4Fe-4S binding protein [Raoultibacter sp.]